MRNGRGPCRRPQANIFSDIILVDFADVFMDDAQV